MPAAQPTTSTSDLLDPPGAPPLWAHQAHDFIRFQDSTYFALFYEPRCGKTRPILRLAAHHFLRPQAHPQHIDCLIVMAPTSAWRNWVTDEAPRWLPPWANHRAHAWNSKDTTKRGAQELEAILAHPGLLLLTFNYEATRSQRARKYLAALCNRRHTMLCCDESDDLGTPNAVQTKVCRNLAKRCRIRSILTGTPATESPFSLYSQTNILQMRLLGQPDYNTFKHHYAAFEDKRINHNTNTEYEVLKRDPDGRPIYLNLGELTTRLDQFSSRVRKRDCFSIKEPVYQFFDIELTDLQREVYETLKEQYEAELHDQSTVTARHVLTRYLRLQQVCANYWPPVQALVEHQACTGLGCVDCDDLGVITSQTPLKRIDPKHNPRLDAVLQLIRSTPPDTQIIVWARFRQELIDLKLALAAEPRTLAVYDGFISAEDKDRRKYAFQRKELNILLANQKAAARGILLPADLMLYYSNEFSLRMRLQSEERAFDPNNSARSIDIVDLRTESTIDETITQALRAKRHLADQINRDPTRHWL